MCRICDNITSEERYYPQTLGFKDIDFGVLGKGRLYLGMDRDVETEDFQITAELDPSETELSYFCVSERIMYCPFCGKSLGRDEDVYERKGRD